VAIASRATGKRIETWLSPSLAGELKELADRDRRSDRAVEGAPDDHGPIHGKVAMRAYVQNWIDTFDEFRVQPIELIDAGGNQVVAVIRISGRARLSGIETNLTFAVIYRARDGKVARGREYWTKEQALEAAGLRE
jgi:ketosteroid isomerase-like protein